MGVPNQFNDIIQKHLNVFSAWIPIVNKYSLGDYGIFADGVFARLGNIKDDFQVNFKKGSGAAASIDFTSEGARVVKLSGGAEVTAIPAGDVKASIQIEFSKERSFLVKSPSITVVTIDNVQEVAKQLKASGQWDGKWKVVHSVYNATDAVIVSTIEAGTKLNFSGDASALGKMKLGSAGISIDTNKSLGLKINGKDGVIGLGLFRIKSKLFGGWKVDASPVRGLEEEKVIMMEPGNVEDDV